MNVAVQSACWFWNSNNINQYADHEDVVGMTHKINGGTNGLSDRTQRYNAAVIILKG